jgi:hypothetical protein
MRYSKRSHALFEAISCLFFLGCLRGLRMGVGLRETTFTSVGWRQWIIGSALSAESSDRAEVTLEPVPEEEAGLPADRGLGRGEFGWK